MLRVSSLSLPVTEPLAFLDATLLFIIQVVLAHHPDLLSPPDSTEPPISRLRLRPEHRLLDALRELHYALDSYRTLVSDDTLYPESIDFSTTDNFPF